ncbi:carboxylic acid reductase [Mycolicibacterium gadium]|uniref:Carboxylic acid reductase n=1 Tax=Mycolicibacterium gadium TaxID=1794 RepID=A0ABT6GXB0_MYCGU|nr:carboxylic acid reductase [Mycolicibacterium gadium]MDG5485789.1 carboxylic acid reductase [Mycolicibacterium gadium]
MSTDTREERLARRIADLTATDPQFAAAKPDPAVSQAIEDPGLSLDAVVRTVLTAYADRPALGERAVDYVEDRRGRTSAKLLPHYNTITYRELDDRISSLTRALTDVHPGDRVAILGFGSIDYTVIDVATIPLGAVAVPLQTSAPLTALRPIVTETEPAVIASSIDYVDDAAELVLSGHAPSTLVVFDYDPAITDHREAYDAVRARLAEAESTVAVETLQDALERGKTLPARPAAHRDTDDMALLIYTSGSTGAPKGAIYTRDMTGNLWRPASWGWADSVEPSIVLSFMPMSHVMGRSGLFGALSHGGTGYFAAKSDLSTFLEDLALVRPTHLALVPRVWDMLSAEVHSRVERHAAEATDTKSDAEFIDEVRTQMIGNRYLTAVTGSAPTSSDLKTWVKSFLDLELLDGYGSTEAGGVFLDGKVQRPPVIDYKLVDVPDLGYFSTDRPYPRGELLIKTVNMFPGYYKRPEVTAEVFDDEGFYRTGDVVAELGPDRLQYVDRRNFVLKLSQGEFVTASKLEAVFETSPLVRQIYIYGNSARSYLLAVIVPTPEALSQHDTSELRALIGESLADVAKAEDLQSFEVPRDFILETTAFTLENGLLTGIRKLARPKLKEIYGPQLEALYEDLAQGQAAELRELRLGGATRPVIETVTRAAAAMLGSAAADLSPDAHFTDLGGDSLSALTFANLLRDIFFVEVPVGVIVSPANDLGALAEYIETERSGSTRPTFASVHGRGATEIHARDLTLGKFLDAHTLANAPALPYPSQQVRTVLLTGATGFLGRYLALDWLERMSLVGGKVISLVRAKDDATARQRLDETFDSGDPALFDHYRRLAAGHLEVLAGDKGEPGLGLDETTWQRLADTVDLIVDPAALVNHVLPYDQLFGPNVVGTAELIRLALTSKLKPFVYLSTVGVGDQIEPSAFVEDADVRQISATRVVNDSYANGYGNSKWAGEVLLREAHDLSGLPVEVFRCDMILAEPKYAGQLNVPDMFTRLMLSLVATGIAPGSFYELDAAGHRQRAHYDGLPVDFIADAISTLGAQHSYGFETFHVMNPHDDGLGLDEFVDWLVDAGYPIDRVADYGEWLQRFEMGMRGLPDRRRQASLLPLLHSYAQPAKPLLGSFATTDRFRAAVQDAKIGPDKDIPHVTAEIIVKYVTDLQLLGLL